MGIGRLYGRAASYTAFAGMVMLVVGLLAQIVVAPATASCLLQATLGGEGDAECGYGTTLPTIPMRLGLLALASSVMVGLIAVMPHAARERDITLLIFMSIVLALISVSAAGLVRIVH